jgi:hypothetical protein
MTKLIYSDIFERAATQGTVRGPETVLDQAREAQHLAIDADAPAATPTRHPYRVAASVLAAAAVIVGAIFVARLAGSGDTTKTVDQTPAPTTTQSVPGAARAFRIAYAAPTDPLIESRTHDHRTGAVIPDRLLPNIVRARLREAGISGATVTEESDGSVRVDLAAEMPTQQAQALLGSRGELRLTAPIHQPIDPGECVRPAAHVVTKSADINTGDPDGTTDIGWVGPVPNTDWPQMGSGFTCWNYLNSQYLDLGPVGLLPDEATDPANGFGINSLIRTEPPSEPATLVLDLAAGARAAKDLGAISGVSGGSPISLTLDNVLVFTSTIDYLIGNQVSTTVGNDTKTKTVRAIIASGPYMSAVTVTPS